jgi:hypothetical protein
MRQRGARGRPDELHQHIGCSHVAAQLAAQHEDQRHDRIEVRSRDRAERGDKDKQHARRRHGVRQQRHRIVLREAFGHDAGADHRRHQQTRSKGLSCQPPSNIVHVAVERRRRAAELQVVVA